MKGIKALRLVYLSGGTSEEIPPTNIFKSNEYKSMFNKLIVPDLTVTQIREILKRNQFGCNNYLCL